MTSVQPRRTSIVAGLVIALAAVGAETGLCWVLLPDPLPDVVMVYLLGVVLLAVRFGYVASIPASVLSVAAFDYFFTLPHFSFDVQDKRYWLTFVLMAFVAAVISRQTERIRQRQARTASLYLMTRELSVSGSSEAVAAVGCRHVRDLFDCEAWILLPDGNTTLRAAGSEGSAPPAGMLAEAERHAAAVSGGTHPEVDVARPERLVALRAPGRVLGVLAVRPSLPRQFASAPQQDLLETFASQIANALERTRLADEAQRAQVDVQNERLRNALLSSVSHASGRRSR